MSKFYKTTLEYRKRDVSTKKFAPFYKELMANKVSIGVHKTQGMNNVQKAVANEFGAKAYVVKKSVYKRTSEGRILAIKKDTIISIPPRPFIRLYLYPPKLQDLHKAFSIGLNEQIKSKLNAPVTMARKVLKTVAEVGEFDMKETILDQTTLKRNADVTVFLKGFDFPLYETGKMVKAIRGKVIRKS